MTGGSRTVDSPIGPLVVVSDGEGRLTGLHIGTGTLADAGTTVSAPVRSPAWHVLERTVGELEEYFAGRRAVFSAPVALAGTAFQRRVWAALQRIPFGTTISYGELARRVGRPGAARAVGHANGRNPVAVVVPCHRVIGASGELTGYGGGLEAKRFLLDLEEQAPAGRPS